MDRGQEFQAIATQLLKKMLDVLILDPVSRVPGIPGWYWILGIKCSDTTGVGLVY